MDIAGLRGNAAGMPAKVADTPAKIKEAATQFEAMLIQQMLQTSSSSGSGGMGDSEDQNSTVLELGQQQFAQALAASGGMGLAKMVVAGLNQNAHRSTEAGPHARNAVEPRSQIPNRR